MLATTNIKSVSKWSKNTKFKWSKIAYSFVIPNMNREKISFHLLIILT
jgi:hypothetical protein